MKILYLGPENGCLEKFLASTGDAVLRTQEALTPESAELDGADFLVSFGYRHILKPGVLARAARGAVNLHVAYLPWNRGAHPNLWSILEDTPKGVTIHAIDAGVDTGAIYAQEEVPLENGDTFATSHARLLARIEALFKRVWPDIRAGKLAPKPQHGAGSFHKVSDLDRVSGKLTAGWNTPVAEFIGSLKA